MAKSSGRMPAKRIPISDSDIAAIVAKTIKTGKGENLPERSSSPYSPPLSHPPVSLPEQPTSVVEGTESSQVVRSFSQPLHKRHIGGRRLSLYMLILLSLTSAILALSYLQPWVLLDSEKPFDPEVNVNLSLLRRFPFTNITLPEEGAEVLEPAIQIAGYIKPGIDLYLNNKPLSYDTHGFYSTAYQLEEGENTFILEARLGTRRKAVKRTIFYRPLPSDREAALPFPLEATDPGEAEIRETPSPIRVRVYSWPESTWIEARVDGVDRERETIIQGTALNYAAQESIVITVGDGSSVVVNLNGVDQGPLSRENKQMSAQYNLDMLNSI